MREDLKERIVDYYNSTATVYQDLWGGHIHHGLWKTGRETKEEAQCLFISDLASHGEIFPGAHVLDIGCGLGGGSIFLAKTLGAHCTGITNSPKQVELATTNAKKNNVESSVVFLTMDAENMAFQNQEDSFDFVWIVEALCHLLNKESFLCQVNKLLKKGGKLLIADWFRSVHIPPDRGHVIKSIEDALLVPPLMTNYQCFCHLANNGFQVIFFEDVSTSCLNSWDFPKDLVNDLTFQNIGMGNSMSEVQAVYNLIRTATGKEYRCCFIVAEKISPPTQSDR
eukprot:TRINITY_DN5603_c0_g2_i1.p1 TRINITY_DN5603_c0_g2~~TRINITY_DN5603_c0_g2_i1.p1  ORF type:complete len:282 (+),score=24.61 TRINITY_DN5603_c0_g2_i1:166-1011(+)